VADAVSTVLSPSTATVVQKMAPYMRYAPRCAMSEERRETNGSA